jgi:hypothetical protein
MSSKPNYMFLRKKWYFWIPLILMFIAFIPWLILVFVYITRNGNFVIIPLLLLVINLILLACSYIFINRVVHAICGSIMLIIVIIYFTFYHEYFQSSFFIFDCLPIILNLFAGLFLIILSFLKINLSQSGTTWSTISNCESFSSILSETDSNFMSYKVIILFEHFSSYFFHSLIPNTYIGEFLHFGYQGIQIPFPLV